MLAFHFDTVDSTNDAARRLIAEGRLRGCGYVLAREQTAGRGTHGRTWISPRDAGIYLSVVRTNGGQATANTSLITTAAGLACVSGLTAVTGLTTIRLKPVNDLMAHGRKLGGILTECEIESGAMKSLIVGIGLNLRVADRELPPGAIPPIALEECLAPSGLDCQLAQRIVDRLVTDVDAAMTQVVRGWPAEVR